MLVVLGDRDRAVNILVSRSDLLLSHIEPYTLCAPSAMSVGDPGQVWVSTAGPETHPAAQRH